MKSFRRELRMSDLIYSSAGSVKETFTILSSNKDETVCEHTNQGDQNLKTMSVFIALPSCFEAPKNGRMPLPVTKMGRIIFVTGNAVNKFLSGAHSCHQRARRSES